MTNQNPTFPENIKAINLIAFNTVRNYSVKPKNILHERAAAITIPQTPAAFPSSRNRTKAITNFPAGLAASRFILLKKICIELGIDYIEG